MREFVIVECFYTSHDGKLKLEKAKLKARMIHKAILEAAYNSVCGVKHVVELFQPCGILEQHSAQRGDLPLVFLLTQTRLCHKYTTAADVIIKVERLCGLFERLAFGKVKNTTVFLLIFIFFVGLVILGWETLIIEHCAIGLLPFLGLQVAIGQEDEV